MKTFLILKAMLLWAYVSIAQTTQKNTVHIKKTERVNGVEKTWDTTYTTEKAEAEHVKSAGLMTEGPEGREGGTIQTMIVTGTCYGKTGTPYTFKYRYADSTGDGQIYRIIKSGCPLTKEEEEEYLKTWNAGKEAREGKMTVMDNVMVMEKPTGANARARKIVLVRAVKIDQASAEETSRLKGSTGITAGELTVNDLSCYPNPASETISLAFSAPGREDALVEVYSSDGSKVRSESIKGTEGKFSVTLDISNEAKGIYFVRITQGATGTTKKLIVE